MTDKLRVIPFKNDPASPQAFIDLLRCTTDLAVSKRLMYLQITAVDENGHTVQNVSITSPVK